jgi:hypothetical protein
LHVCIDDEPNRLIPRRDWALQHRSTTRSALARNYFVAITLVGQVLAQRIFCIVVEQRLIVELIIGFNWRAWRLVVSGSFPRAPLGPTIVWLSTAATSAATASPTPCLIPGPRFIRRAWPFIIALEIAGLLLHRHRLVRVSICETAAGRSRLIAKIGWSNRCVARRLLVSKLRRLIGRGTKYLMPQAHPSRFLQRLLARGLRGRLDWYRFNIGRIANFRLRFASTFTLAMVVALVVPCGSSIPTGFIIAAPVISATAALTPPAALSATLVRPFSLFSTGWSLSIVGLAVVTLPVRPLGPASRRLLTFALTRFRPWRRRAHFARSRDRRRRRFGFLDGRQT